MHQLKTNHRMWQFEPMLLMCTLYLLATSVVAAPQVHETMTIMVEDAAAPWSKRDGTGYANDVVVAAFQEMAVNVQLKVVPYARCKYMVLNGTSVACFNMSWLPEFEGRIKMASQPIYTVNNDIFEAINAPLPKSPKSPCTLPPGTVVGTVRGYEYSPQATALESAGVVFEDADSDVQNLRKLAARRLSAALIVTNDLEAKEQKARQAGTEDVVRFAFNCGLSAATIGFSLTHPDGLRALKMYDEGYRRIEANGVLKQIHMHWFPSQPVVRP
ncbi:substrate-binding periplasmic protein [Pseudomonas moorei]|uniref:substrate-binding periplasmic protein n=1 Tax=Pseudomonas moorei TaxID=395599 RepID=UPI00200E7D8D|nr:transporter substrate-binding domain-containing protein [Pseudomonas moorei]